MHSQGLIRQSARSQGFIYSSVLSPGLVRETMAISQSTVFSQALTMALLVHKFALSSQTKNDKTKLSWMGSWGGRLLWSSILQYAAYMLQGTCSLEGKRASKECPTLAPSVICPTLSHCSRQLMYKYWEYVLSSECSAAHNEVSRIGSCILRFVMKGAECVMTQTGWGIRTSKALPQSSWITSNLQKRSEHATHQSSWSKTNIVTLNINHVLIRQPPAPGNFIDLCYGCRQGRAPGVRRGKRQYASHWSDAIWQISELQGHRTKKQNLLW